MIGATVAMLLVSVVIVHFIGPSEIGYVAFLQVCYGALLNQVRQGYLRGEDWNLDFRPTATKGLFWHVYVVITVQLQEALYPKL